MVARRCTDAPLMGMQSRSRRGQLKMFENIGVMIVFFFLLASGMNFYFSVQESSLKKDFARFEQMRAVQVAVQSQFMPELDCSYAGDITQKCIDLQKALAVAGTTPERFTPTFGFANIVLSWYDTDFTLTAVLLVKLPFLPPC